MGHDVTFPLHVEVAHIFNTYGPRMHPSEGRVVSNFIVQALEGNPITVCGDGSQTQSFCYVDDLITGGVSTISRAPMPPDDPKRRRPDISLARDTLNWAPKVTLKGVSSKPWITSEGPREEGPGERDLA